MFQSSQRTGHGGGRRGRRAGMFLALACAGVAGRFVAAEEFPAIPVEAAQRELRELEPLRDIYFRCPPPNLPVMLPGPGATNAPIQTRSGLFAERRTALELALAPVRELDEKIRREDRYLQAHRADALNQFAATGLNDRIQNRNDLVTERQALAARQEQAVNEYNRDFGAFQSWFAAHQDESFYRRVNTLNARLARTPRWVSTRERRACADAAARLRDELLALIRHDRKNAGGVMLVEATFDGRIKCNLIADTGASTVTIPLALVVMLGWEDRLGAEVETTLAGGLHLKGRRIVLPRLSVAGHAARDVEALVLPEVGCGVDGLLGHTFLDRFAYRFDPTNDPPLILEEKR